LILDTRDAQTFAQGFIPNSVNIGIDGNFAPWVGALIPDIRQNILIVAEEGKEEEVVTRMARVGYDGTIGYLEGGIGTWEKAGKELNSIQSVSADELAGLRTANPALSVLDVRKKSEYYSEHLIGAENIPLDYINEHLTEIDRDK